MERFLSGITLSSEISVISPRPWQVGQAPKGELKENMRGSRLSNTISGWLGQAPKVLNIVSSWKRSSSFFFSASAFLGVDDYHGSFADLKRLLHSFRNAAAFLINDFYCVNNGFNPVFLVPHKLNFFFD